MKKQNKKKARAEQEKQTALHKVAKAVMEIAKHLLKNELPTSLIAATTGLSEAEIEKLSIA